MQAPEVPPKHEEMLDFGRWLKNLVDTMFLKCKGSLKKWQHSVCHWNVLEVTGSHANPCMNIKGFSELNCFVTGVW